MPDEDDALVQVINHHSAVHVAGFVSATTVFALGTDETLSFYHAPVGGNRGGQQQQQDEEEDIPPVEFGDLRPRLGGADYVVDLVTSPTGTAQPFLAAGSFSEQWLDLVPLANGTGASVTGLDWSVRPEARVRIPGAHGEELVRHIYAEIDAQSTVSKMFDSDDRLCVDVDLKTLADDHLYRTRSSSRAARTAISDSGRRPRPTPVGLASRRKRAESRLFSDHINTFTITDQCFQSIAYQTKGETPQKKKKGDWIS